MKTNLSIVKLQEEINERIHTALEALLKNDITKAKENIEWASTATDIIAKTKKKPNKIKWAIMVGLISLFIIGLGLVIKIPSANISVDIVTNSVHFKLQNEWVLNNRFSFSGLNITNLKLVRSAGANIDISAEQPFSINFKGDHLVADKLTFSPGADITIQLHDSSQHFIVKNDTLVTGIQVQRAHISTGNGLLDTSVNFEVPEIFNIESFPSAAVPIDIMITDTSAWSFKDMRISEISFLEESSPGTGLFISSIISGNIKVLEIDKDTPLEEGDWLTLSDIKTRRMKISRAASNLLIHIEGEVSRARAGTELFEKTLNPSALEYLYYAKSFAFFWSAIVCISSLVWSVKNSILSDQ